MNELERLYQEIEQMGKDLSISNESLSALRNFLFSEQRSKSVGLKLREELEKIEKTLELVLESDLVSKTTEMYELLSTEIEDLLDDLLIYAKNKNVSIRKYNFYVDKFKILKEESGKMDLAEFRRRISILLLQLNGDINE